MQCCTLSPNNTFPTLPDAVVLLAIIALATLFCIAATVRVSAVRFAAHIPLAAVWIVLSFVKVATCDATGSCYRHEKKMHVYVSVGLLRAKLAGGGQNLRVGEGEGPGDGEGLSGAASLAS